MRWTNGTLSRQPFTFLSLFSITVICSTSAGVCQTVKLYGKVDALQSTCAEAGLTLNSGGQFTTISSVKLGSPAAYAGLKVKDAILDCTVQKDNALLITIQREGKVYQVSLITRRNRPADYIAKNPQPDHVPVASKPAIPELKIEPPKIPDVNVPEFDDDDAAVTIGPDGYPTLSVTSKHQCRCRPHQI